MIAQQTEKINARTVVTLNWDKDTDLIISAEGIKQHDHGHSAYTLLDLDTAILVAKAVLAIAEPSAVAGDVLTEVQRIVAKHTEEGRRIAEQEAEDARQEALFFEGDRYDDYFAQVCSDYYHDRI